MNMVMGVSVVLASLVAFLALVVLLGLPWAIAMSGRSGRGSVIRHSLWWGFVIVSILALVINQFLALGSSITFIIFGSLALVSGVVGVIGLRARGTSKRALGLPDAFLGFGLVVVVVTLGLRALGPVTNYDTGLYHLGAIQYADQFAAIPGLASVFFAYGYATSQFPLAAAMTWTPMGAEGYRVLNMAILLLALVDLWIRLRSRERNAGTWVLATGLSVVVITMLPLADYWVVSPTQDASVFILTVVSGAYLSEALSRRRWVPAAATAVIVAVSAALIRTTMLAFLLATCVAIVILALRRRQLTDPKSLRIPALLTTLLAGAGFIASGARDYILSGWWMYPLSLLPADVPWLAPDPTGARMATLGAARDPENLWVAAESWLWIQDWAPRAIRSWEFFALALLWTAAILGVIWRRPPRALFIALLPSGVAAGFWFLFTPPAFRFGWGPLFTLGTITLGWVAWLQIQRTPLQVNWVKTGAAGLFLLVCVVTLAVRIDYSAPTQSVTARWLPITFTVTPITQAEVTSLELPSGLPALVPITGDQCWEAFPVCSPQLPETLRLKGATLQEGFLY